MKMYCISDNIDTAIGLKLTGVDSIVVQNEAESNENIEKVLKDETIGVLIFTDKIYEFSKEKLDEIRKNKKIPLLVKI